MKLLILSVLFFFSPFLGVRATEPPACYKMGYCMASDQFLDAQATMSHDDTLLPVMVDLQSSQNETKLVVQGYPTYIRGQKKGVLLLAPKSLLLPKNLITLKTYVYIIDGLALHKKQPVVQ